MLQMISLGTILEHFLIEFGGSALKDINNWSFIYAWHGVDNSCMADVPGSMKKTLFLGVSRFYTRFSGGFALTFLGASPVLCLKSHYFLHGYSK